MSDTAMKFKNPRTAHHMGTRTCSIEAVGSYVPEKVLTNADLEKMVETSDEWIRTRTGIIQRHYADPGVATSHLGSEAAKKVLAQRGISAALSRSSM